MQDDLRRRRLAMLERHFEAEVAHDWDACIATFNGHPRYEIVPTNAVHDGEEAVRRYHRSQRVAFPDQRHENVRFHVADDDTVIAEFDLLGTNTGTFLGAPPTGRSFRVPTIAVFAFDGERICNERVYLDLAALLGQIGRIDVLTGSGRAG